MLQLALIAALTGVPIGLLLPSRWETKARRLPLPWLPFGGGSLTAILGALLVKLPLALAICWGTPLLALRLFDLAPRSDVWRSFAIAYLLAIACGKLARYAYWRWALRGQLL